MAVTSTAILTDLAIIYTVAEKDVVRRYSDVKISATDQDVFLVAQTIVGLQDQTLSMVQRRTTNELENVI